LTIAVSVHALLRWRERGAEYADCSVDDVARVYREASPVDHPGPGRAKKPNTLYRRHPAGWVFVASPRGLRSVLIMTVYPPDDTRESGGARNYLRPKTKRHPARPHDPAVAGTIEPGPDWSDGTERARRKTEKAAQKQATKQSNVKRIELLEAELASLQGRLAALEAMLRGEDPQQPTSEEKFREPAESVGVGETNTFGR
jgi:hypothetical protein